MCLELFTQVFLSILNSIHFVCFIINHLEKRSVQHLQDWTWNTLITRRERTEPNKKRTGPFLSTAVREAGLFSGNIALYSQTAHCTISN